MRPLAEATWPEVGAGELVLVPVGSIEQHGPHLPFDTDTTIAASVATAAAERLGARVTPAVCFGSSGEHQSFPGTASIGAETLRLLLIELVRSLRTWSGPVLLVNAHGGNRDALDAVVDRLRSEGHAIDWVACATEDTDLHAGRTETSLMLHLRPGSVRLDRAVAGDTRPLREILPLMVAGGVAAVSANGVLGDPAGANASEGSALFERLCASVVEAAHILTASAASVSP